MNAVVTITVGDVYNKIAEYTHPTIKMYASKIGAEFINITESTCSTPHWDKFKIYDLLNKYERIIYIDTDILVREDCPNLLDIVSIGSFGAFNEAPFTDGRAIVFNRALNDYGISLNKWDGSYYNTGVMVLSQIHKYLFKKPELEIPNFYEQSYINIILAKNNVKMHSLPYDFNRMSCMDPYVGIDRHNAYIIHYAGFPNISTVINIINKDVDIWKKDSPDYKYKYHILINVVGGLGDQIAAEPSIRYMVNNVYKDEDIVIKTHFPRIFDHINVPVYEHNNIKLKDDTPYYLVTTLPDPTTHTWQVVSNLLCHTIDFSSIALMRRTIPNRDKNIKLNVYAQDILNVRSIVGNIDLENTVLIHPGRHWQSKTFPISWWQEVIDGLCDKMQVCLIGKNENTRGTLPVVVSDKIKDTRNLLDLGGLFAIISMAKVLLTNDSAPVYIAGAFDTHIVLIPTCKHSDHILPWRQGSQYYKADALYKKLTLDSHDSRPTTVHGSTCESVIGNILDYLPNPVDVINCINNII